MNIFYLVAVVAMAVFVWYAYQVGSRKKVWLRYKLKQAIVFFSVYWISILVVRNHGFDQIVVALISVFVGYGVAFVSVKQPRLNRRIPKSVRKAVIARDLESKGLVWDNTKYHIDHRVPLSKGGDNSIRNLRVIPKEANLIKGNKMPGVRDFIR
jgi:hypothetical protein